MTDPLRKKSPLNGVVPTVRVWDPIVRVFHWSLVLAFTMAWLSAEEVQPLHEFAGYTIMGLVAVRLIWGIVGSRYARFAQFVHGPADTAGYLRSMIRGRERRYLGHNPAGAAMILAMLLTISGTAFTGWLMEGASRSEVLSDAPAVTAPASADDDDGAREGAEVEGPLKEVHETLAKLMLLLAALHVGGVVFASIRHRENLARAMVTGAKRAPRADDVI